MLSSEWQETLGAEKRRAFLDIIDLNKMLPLSVSRFLGEEIFLMELGAQCYHHGSCIRLHPQGYHFESYSLTPIGHRTAMILNAYHCIHTDALYCNQKQVACTESRGSGTLQA
ncbi:hypothetical protein cyc_04641 [Cyclospora cayetanensis]|uniref:Uncharacterized protein n=1 Tax=Cyclospora cayetanensis TaxID=88456 RepID=A0A1D3CVY7_9EIME|nr:hypothetical protein cyc_04641 [Cyclospora cayetanensis]